MCFEGAVDNPENTYFPLSLVCCQTVDYRQYLSTRDGLEDSSFGLQLILKGMANIGARADRLLERGILGYSHDFELRTSFGINY